MVMLNDCRQLKKKIRKHREEQRQKKEQQQPSWVHQSMEPQHKVSEINYRCLTCSQRRNIRLVTQIEMKCKREEVESTMGHWILPVCLWWRWQCQGRAFVQNWAGSSAEMGTVANAKYQITVKHRINMLLVLRHTKLQGHGTSTVLNGEFQVER